MSRVRLSESRIEALELRKSPYDVRDSGLKGFGVRVLPSGTKRFFVHSQHEGRRIWKTVGDAGGMHLDEARQRAVTFLAALRRDETPASREERLFEAVSKEVFGRYGRKWKPRTMKVNRGYLRNHIMPWFGEWHIADITKQDVHRWFASLRATPVAADRSAPILSVITRQAEVYGYRREGSNPCIGIRRYRRRGRERFLSMQELGRVAFVLNRCEEDRPGEVAFIRLLLLTGCRRDEIRTLRWSDYREGHLFLRDSKTGPRTVALNVEARGIIERRMAQAGSPWVFPSVKNPYRPRHIGLPLWYAVRREAGIEDVRLHDLRHMVASQAVLNGVSLPVVARLLGHSNVHMTMRYAHVGDHEVEEAAERVGRVIGTVLGL